MGAAFVIFLIGLVTVVLGIAELRRSAVQGPGTALAGMIFSLLGVILLLIAVARFMWGA